MAPEDEGKAVAGMDRGRRGESDIDASTFARKERQRAADGRRRGGGGEHRCNRFLVSIFHVENWLVHPSGLIYEGRRLKKKP